MKTKKRIMSLVLSFVMVLGICGSVFAKDATVNDAVGVTVVIDYSNAVKFTEVPVDGYYGNTIFLEDVSQAQHDKAVAAVDKIKAKLPVDASPEPVNLNVDDSNALAALMKVASEKKLAVESEETTVDNKLEIYVTSIETLGENSTGMYDETDQENGGTGGWMFNVKHVDGSIEWPRVAANQYEVKEGDVITWAYTCDWGDDLGQDIWSWE